MVPLVNIYLAVCVAMALFTVEVIVKASDCPTTIGTTVTVSTPKCNDPSPLFANLNGEMAVLSATGPQPVGTTVSVTCGPDDTFVTATFDDGTMGEQDSGGVENFVLFCNAQQQWFLLIAIDTGNTGGKAGTVSKPGSIQCDVFQPFIRK